MFRADYFVDSGAWIAFYNKSDQWHQLITDIFRELADARTPLHTSDVALFEFVTRLRGNGISAERVDEHIAAILESSNVQYVSPEIFDATREKLRRFGNLNFSAVDASILAFADHLDLHRLVSIDGEFEKCNRFVEIRPRTDERRLVTG